MSNSTATKSSRKVTIGLDVGDKRSYVYALDGHGELLEEGWVKTTPEAIESRFRGFGPARVALETGAHSSWIAELLQRLGHEVVVANSRKLPAVTGEDRRNDRTDAKTLAEVAYARPQLLKPVHIKPEEVQVALARVRARDSLVRARTQLVNHVRGVVKSHGGRIPKCSARSFAKQAPEHVPEKLRAILAPHLRLIEELTDAIREHDRAVEHLADEVYPETQLLRQIPGVGPVTALCFVLVIFDPRRFEHSRDVPVYLGLTPRDQRSGESSPQLRITKAGNKLLRRLLVGSAHYILGPYGKDSDLRRHGEKIAKRGGKNAKKRAVVAVARKLAVVLHRLWVTGEVYEPLRNAKREAVIRCDCAQGKQRER